MPHNASLLTTEINAQLSSSGLLGSNAISVAQACAKGYVQFMTTIVKVTTVDVGTAGAGSGAGKIVGALGPAFASACSGQAAANGLLGQSGAATCSAIGLACGNHTSALGQTTSSHVGVGAGFGNGVLIGSLPTAFFGLLMAEASSAGLLGTSVSNLFNAIANGIAPLVPTAVVPTPIAGPPSIVPAAGSGFGSVL